MVWQETKRGTRYLPMGTLPLRAVALVLVWGAYLAWLLAPGGAALLPQLPRYWGLVPPALLVWLVCTYGATYGALALAATPPLHAQSAVSDAHARRPEVLGRPGAVPALGDLPLTLVNAAQLARLRSGAEAAR